MVIIWLPFERSFLCRRFRLGRQEDAHEYLRCVLDAMHEAFLKHIRPKPAPELASTTFVHRIFGGKLRSQVGCGWWAVQGERCSCWWLCTCSSSSGSSGRTEPSVVEQLMCHLAI
jgi:hypothetical protein